MPCLPSNKRVPLCRPCPLPCPPAPPQEPEGALEKTQRSPVAQHVLEPQMAGEGGQPATAARAQVGGRLGAGSLPPGGLYARACLHGPSARRTLRLAAEAAVCPLAAPTAASMPRPSAQLPSTCCPAPPQYDESGLPSGYDVSSAAGEAAGCAKETAAGAAESAQQQAVGVAETVRQAAAVAAEKVGEVVQVRGWLAVFGWGFPFPLGLLGVSEDDVNWQCIPVCSLLPRL